MRSLQFVEPTPDGYLAAIAAAASKGSTRIRFAGTNLLARNVAQQAAAKFPSLAAEAFDAPLAGPDAAKAPPVVVLFETDGDKLSDALIGYLDAPDVALIAPISDRFWSKRALFIVSQPKAGTHLIFELAKALGYVGGGECRDIPVPGHWYFLEFTNAHTSAPDFFIDTVRRAPHGNRAHPFPHHPTLFNYRNPLDIVASEANYYHEDGKTIFYGYLAHRSYEERLVRLIDDPWLLGSIRHRTAQFVAWLDFANVLPLSFEELVGEKGGGDDAAQSDTVWSLMLRLHKPGDPDEIRMTVFNPNSPTFRFGRIGGHQKRFTPQAWEKFKALPQDFMAAYGFQEKPASGPWMPSGAAAYRRRVPRYSKADVESFMIQWNLMGYNIIKLGGRYIGIPPNFPPIDLAKAPPELVKQLIVADHPDTVRFLIHARSFLR